MNNYKISLGALDERNVKASYYLIDGNWTLNFFVMDKEKEVVDAMICSYRHWESVELIE